MYQGNFTPLETLFVVGKAMINHVRARERALARTHTYIYTYNSPKYIIRKGRSFGSYSKIHVCVC